VRDLQSLADSCGYADSLARRERPSLVQDLPQGRPGDQFHHDERHALVHAAVEHRDQVRVAEPGGVPGFPLEPGQEPRVGGELRAKHLDGHVAAEHLIAGPPYRGHPTCAQHLAQHVPAAQDPGARYRHASARCLSSIGFSARTRR